MPASILISFAVEFEAASFRKRLPSGPSSVRIAMTGIGSENAERVIRVQLKSAPPDLLISSGFAGGLSPLLEVGTAVFSADDDFPLRAAMVAAGAVPVKFCTVSKVLVTAQEKRALRAATGGDAADMESEAIRALCQKQGISSATLRIISDSADDDLPLDFNRVMNAGLSISLTRLMLALAKEPAKIGALVRFQRQISAAADQLATILERVLSGAKLG